MKLQILVEMILLRNLFHLPYGLIRMLLKGIVTAVAQEAPVVNQVPRLQVCAVTNYSNMHHVLFLVIELLPHVKLNQALYVVGICM